MEQLQESKNYILIHNGEVVTKNISENIHVVDNCIDVKQASSLQIVYTGDTKNTYETSIKVSSPTLDLMETIAFLTETSYQRKLYIEENAQVTRYSNHDTSYNGSVCLQDYVEVAKNGSITCAYVDFSDTSNESQYVYHLVGENAQAKLRLAALAKQDEKKHFEIHIRHLAPRTIGSMDNFGVVKDQAKLYIDGIGTIEKGNYQSNNQQTNKILVFNSKCEAKANPYLYIDEYDVNAGHGAGVGKVDEEQLYYLQSRGLTKEEALHLITYGYFVPVLEFINNEEVRNQYQELLKAKVGI
jgi:Fe-S cluster assembly protein SufD